jgi:hypothetical protein
MNDRPKKISIETLQGMTNRGEKIVMVTVYDHPSAVIVEQADIDIAFVGDTLAMTVLGHESTVPVTLVVCPTISDTIRGRYVGVQHVAQGRPSPNQPGAEARAGRLGAGPQHAP